jgi:hypothetical protein
MTVVVGSSLRNKELVWGGGKREDWRDREKNGEKGEGDGKPFPFWVATFHGLSCRPFWPRLHPIQIDEHPAEDQEERKGSEQQQQQKREKKACQRYGCHDRKEGETVEQRAKHEDIEGNELAVERMKSRACTVRASSICNLNLA